MLKVLTNIENNYEESFFNYINKKGYYSKRSNLISTLHWNTIS